MVCTLFTLPTGAVSRLVVLAIAVLFWPHAGVSQQAAIQKLTLTQVEDLVSHHVPYSTMHTEIRRRGLAFSPTPAIVESLRAKGAGPSTLAAIEAPPPTTIKGGVPTPTNIAQSLSATMQSILHTLSDQGPTERIRTQDLRSSETSIRESILDHFNVVADSGTCTVHATHITDHSTFWSRGGTDTVSKYSALVEVTFSLQDVEDFAIEKEGDYWNHKFVEQGHPEDTMTVEPSVFIVHPSASKAIFSQHTSTSTGNNPPKVGDTTAKSTSFFFRDEDAANRAVEAMKMAARLCRASR